MSLDYKVNLAVPLNFRILIWYDTSQESSFRYSKDPLLQEAWTDRIKPHREEHKFFTNQQLIAKLEDEPKSAVYLNYYSAM